MNDQPIAAWLGKLDLNPSRRGQPFLNPKTLKAVPAVPADRIHLAGPPKFTHAVPGFKSTIEAVDDPTVLGEKTVHQNDARSLTFDIG